MLSSQMPLSAAQALCQAGGKPSRRALDGWGTGALQPSQTSFCQSEILTTLVPSHLGCSLPESCSGLQPSVSCCSTWGQLLASPEQHPGHDVPCALHWAGLWCLSWFLTAVQTWDQPMPGAG